MTPFMASIEAAKRAFAEAETAQRRRHRNERERHRKASASDKNYDRDEGRQEGASSGGALQHGGCCTKVPVPYNERVNPYPKLVSWQTRCGAKRM